MSISWRGAMLDMPRSWAISQYAVPSSRSCRPSSKSVYTRCPEKCGALAFDEAKPRGPISHPNDHRTADRASAVFVIVTADPEGLPVQLRHHPPTKAGL